MKKTIKKIWFLLTAGLFCGSLFSAVQAETTFPVNEAGIAAYGKMEPINMGDRPNWANVFKTIETTGDDYVIGTVDVDGMAQPHVYARLDGWIVAYFLKNEETSRILTMNGNLGDTILNRAIEKVNVATRASVVAVQNIKYYDFAHPQADKMTIVRKDIGDYYIAIPGTLYGASYAVKEHYCQNCTQWLGGCTPEQTDTSNCSKQVGLRIDDHDVFIELATDSHPNDRVYGNCDLGLLSAHDGHKMTSLGFYNYYSFSGTFQTTSVEVVFIYKAD